MKKLILIIILIFIGFVIQAQDTIEYIATYPAFGYKHLTDAKIAQFKDTIFLMPGFRWIYISSSIIKDAARHGGDVCELVPEHVNQLLLDKFSTK